MWHSYKLEYPQPVVDKYCILSKIINDKVLGIYQTWIPTLLESFLTVQIRKQEEFNQRIVMQIWMLHSYKLEQPQPLVDNDYILPKFKTNKVLGIYQSWFSTLLESFLTKQMRRKKESLTKKSSCKFE